jgi:hypothetical protein
LSCHLCSDRSGAHHARRTLCFGNRLITTSDADIVTALVRRRRRPDGSNWYLDIVPDLPTACQSNR